MKNKWFQRPPSSPLFSVSSCFSLVFFLFYPQLSSSRATLSTSTLPALSLSVSLWWGWAFHSINSGFLPKCSIVYINKYLLTPHDNWKSLRAPQLYRVSHFAKNPWSFLCFKAVTPKIFSLTTFVIFVSSLCSVLYGLYIYIYW